MDHKEPEMAKQIKKLEPPQGCSRVFFRAPIWLYRLGLGGLFGKRFVLLNHIGRKSGLPRQAVLEVVQYQPETNTYVVCVGFGKKSQWYQNLMANPEVSIQVGWRKWPVTAEQLSPQDGAEVFVDFCRRYPGEAKFAAMLGYQVDGSEGDYRQMGEMMTFIAFRPM
jgi:deazaflavin-dependent oxidoreductase (nitroreductase family)